MADEEQVPAAGSPQVADENTTVEETVAEPATEEQQLVQNDQPVDGDAPLQTDATESAASTAQEVDENKEEKPEGESSPAEVAADNAEQPSGDGEVPAEGTEETPAAKSSELAEGEEPLTDGEIIPSEDAAKAEDVAQGSRVGSQAESTVGEGDPAAENVQASETLQEGEEVPKEEGAEATAAEEESPKTEEEAAQDTAATPVPQSDTFADGEKPESPAPHVGEVLSRETSPSSNEQQEAAEGERTFSPPVPNSPRESQAEEHFDVEALEEEIISPEQDRDALVEMYHAAIAEREQFQQQNHQLQHKLAEYFKKKKSDEQKAESIDKNEADQEQRYLKYMSQLEELRAEDQQIRNMYMMEIEELEQKCEEKKQEVDAHRAKFVEFKHQVALNALNSRSGKPIPPKDIEQYLSAEDRKDQEVIGVRLENIKLKNKLKKKEQQLKSKEELADGLHLIDFEQLKIENQTYNEKIEERNEELLKLRKKITNTVQVLTHLKEKLQFVQGENSLLKNKLKDVEGAVAQKRDVLTRTKQARDALRIDNHRLRQNCGLLGNEPLLRDFEERKDEADALKDRLERLKMQHAELTLNTSSVRRKIEQIKATEQS